MNHPTHPEVKPDALPPLPPTAKDGYGMHTACYYTADQMREYAQAALAAPVASPITQIAPVTDEDRLYPFESAKNGLRHALASDAGELSAVYSEGKRYALAPVAAQPQNEPSGFHILFNLATSRVRFDDAFLIRDAFLLAEYECAVNAMSIETARDVLRLRQKLYTHSAAAQSIYLRAEPFDVELSPEQEARFEAWVGVRQMSLWTRSVARLTLLLNTSGKGLIDYGAAQHFANEIVARTTKPVAQPVTDAEVKRLISEIRGASEVILVTARLDSAKLEPYKNSISRIALAADMLASRGQAVIPVMPATDAELLAWARDLAPAMLDQYADLAHRHILRWLGGKAEFLKA